VDQGEGSREDMGCTAGVESVEGVGGKGAGMDLATERGQQK
jgi:hypothetical protein